MPLTVSTGISRKAGLPDYGSVGASCNVQFELDAGALQHDLAAFQQQVRNAYEVCSQAVNDELARQISESSDRHTGSPATNGSAAGSSNGSTQNGNGHRATAKQLGYARTLAGQIEGLSVQSLDSVAQRMFAKPLADLSSLEASGMIDTLKEIKAGTISVENALNGATP